MVRAGDVIRASDVTVQACRVTRSAVQSIPRIIETVVSFDTEVFDTDGMHSTSLNPSRITFNTAGYYLVGFYGSFASNAANVYTRIFGEIMLNGSTALARDGRGGNNGTEQPPFSVTTMYPFNVGDYVEAVAYQDSGGDKDLIVSTGKTPIFWAFRIGDL